MSVVINVYSIYDSKAQAYLTPFFASTDGVAIRWFASAAHDEKHEFSRFAADYTLFRIGSFDQVSGRLDECLMVNLGTALVFRSQLAPQVAVKEVAS